MEERETGERLRINHRGLNMGLDAAVEFLKALQRWIEKNKKFRVTFDVVRHVEIDTYCTPASN